MSDIALNWIDGEWRSSEQVSTSVNPANGTAVGAFANGTGASSTNSAFGSAANAAGGGSVVRST